jgi:hypothetical protein
MKKRRDSTSPKSIARNTAETGRLVRLGTVNNVVLLVMNLSTKRQLRKVLSYWFTVVYNGLFCCCHLVRKWYWVTIDMLSLKTNPVVVLISQLIKIPTCLSNCVSVYLSVDLDLYFNWIQMSPYILCLLQHMIQWMTRTRLLAVRHIQRGISVCWHPNKDFSWTETASNWARQYQAPKPETGCSCHDHMIPNDWYCFQCYWL